MPKYSRPTGTQDILPEDQVYWEYLRARIGEIASSYGFGRIDIPIFEDDRTLHARHRRRDRRHLQGNVRLQGQRRSPHRAAPGIHRRCDARLHRKRDASPAQTGQTLLHRPGVPLRTPAGRALPPTPPVQCRNPRRPEMRSPTWR